MTHKSKISKPEDTSRGDSWGGCLWPEEIFRFFFGQTAGKGEIMKTYSMHRAGGACNVTLQGDNIIEAIERNFGLIVREADIGNAAGYSLISVTSKYRPEILGGKGGVDVTIESIGRPLCHNSCTDPHTTRHIWLEADSEDLPTPYNHSLGPGPGC